MKPHEKKITQSQTNTHTHIAKNDEKEHKKCYYHSFLSVYKMKITEEF